jgi:hypothetical protein
MTQQDNTLSKIDNGGDKPLFLISATDIYIRFWVISITKTFNILASLKTNLKNKKRACHSLFIS